MDKRAIERVPIEIWTLILRKVISSPAFPFLDGSHGPLGSGVLFASHLFLSECDVYQETREVQRAITTLRLVCRSWELIASNFHRMCVITNCENTNYPTKDIKTLKSVERIHAVSDGTRAWCFCSFIPSKEPCFLEYPEDDTSVREMRGWWEDLEDESVKEVLAGVRILSVGSTGLDMWKLIAQMPNLQVLSVRFPWGKYVRKIEPLHTFPFQPRLSHLHLTALTWATFCNTFSLQLPLLRSLRYLGLWLYRGEDDPIRREVEWNLPKLETLSIRGKVQFEVKEEVGSLILQCGHTIGEFVDRLDYLGRDFETPKENKFPRLHTYGSELNYLMRSFKEIPPAQPTHLRNLLLYNIDWRCAEDYALLAEQFITYMRRWGFNNVIFMTSWSDLKFPYDESLYRTYNQFFGEFMKTELDFSDTDGIELRDPRCDRFWEMDILE
jgi:hypothetical protein